MYGEDLELLNRASYYGFKHYLVHDSLVLHDFDYPPKDESLRLMKETNLIAAHYLDLNSRWKGHVFATKGLIVSFSRGQFTRFKFIFLGYLQFFSKVCDVTPRQNESQITTGFQVYTTLI